MKPVRRLKKLRIIASRRAMRLKSLINACVVPITSDGDRVVAFVVIEALNLWASFARAYYLSCVLKATTEAGGRVAIVNSTIRTVTDALGFSVKLFKPHVRSSGPFSRREEPAWHDTSNLLKVLTSLGASNIAQVQAALSYPTSVFKQLPVARNFFAHRNEDTARKTTGIARDLGLSVNARPSEMLCEKAKGRPQNVLADWLDDLRIVIELMCR